MSRRRNKLSEEILAAPDVPEQKLARDFDDAVDAFLRDCRIRNLSEHTVKFYRNELNAFRVLLEKQGVDTDPQKIDSRVIKERVILRMMDDVRKETAN
jgi:integrase/recombinase XerD